METNRPDRSPRTRSSRTRRRYLATLAAAGSVALAGCGGAGDGANDTNNSTTLGGGASTSSCAPDEITYEPSLERDTTIQDYVESGQFADQVETSDRFDFATSGTRSWTWEWDEGTEFPQNMDIYVPIGSDVLVVWITALSTGCRDASLPAYETLVSSTRSA